MQRFSKYSFRPKERPRLAVLLLSMLMLLPPLFSGCSLDDERDVCCGMTILNYRYVRYSADEYKEFVHHMRHFLFDEQGLFIREVPQDPNHPQRIFLKNIAEGNYSMLTIGNPTDAHTELSQLVAGKSSYKDFQLMLAKKQTAPYPNGDQLFWNSRSFNASDTKRQEYMCDLSNVHCHLYVHVSWEDLPDHEGVYTMKLSGVSSGYDLNPATLQSIKINEEVNHTFPMHFEQMTEHSIDVSMFGLELEGEFITLRYRDDRIPTFQLFYDGAAVTQPIDLTKAFKEWGWKPDRHPEQIYRISIKIMKSGNVVVTQEFEGTVLDWIDGGTVNV